MVHEKHPICFEEIETIPAADLLDLSYHTLNQLIRDARRREHKAQTVATWLEGIKIEKSFRGLDRELNEKGGQDDQSE